MKSIAREALFSEMRFLSEHKHSRDRLVALGYRIGGMIDMAHDIGAITPSTAERCAEWMLAYVESKGVVL